MAFSPDGKQLASGSGDKTIKLWSVTTGQALRTFQSHSWTVLSVAFSPDGKTLVSGSLDDTIKLWNVATGQVLRTLQGHSQAVNSVAFSPDGKTLASGSEDQTIKLWNVATGQVLRTFRSDYARSVAFSPDGKSLASGGYPIKLWDIATGQVLRTFQGHSDWVNSVAFSPDGKTLASGSGDETIKLWEVGTGQVLRTLQGHFDKVTSVVFSPDGKRLFSIGGDEVIRVWTANGSASREVCAIYSFVDGSWAVIDPDGRYDASNGGDVAGLHWVIGNEPISLKQLKARYYHPNLLARLLGHNPEPLRDVTRIENLPPAPKVALEAPKPGQSRVTIRVTNQGGGIGRVRVLLDNNEIQADARGPVVDPAARERILPLDLSRHVRFLTPGKTATLTVIAANAEGSLNSRGVQFAYTVPVGPPPAPPRFWGVVVGVSDYEGTNLDLRFAAKDAEDFATALRLGATKLFGADRVQVSLLTTSGPPGTLSPTKEQIAQVFATLRDPQRGAKPGDVLVVYLAGHGVSWRERERDVYCYLTRDAPTTDTAVLARDAGLRKAVAITSDELGDWITQCPAKRRVLVLDTCAAGAALARLAERREVPSDQILAIERLKDRTGFHVLMGCASDAVSYEASRYGQGLLTYALLEAMKGAKLRDEEYVDIAPLFGYAADRVVQLAANIGGIQKPQVGAPEGGGSFDVGRLTAEERPQVPLAAERPLILRPVLLDAEAGFDRLELMPRLRQALRERSVGARGQAPPLVFVDAEELPGAVRPSGTYTVVGDTVSVRLVLRRDQGAIGAPRVIEGTRADVTGLVTRVVEAIMAAAGQP